MGMTRKEELAAIAVVDPMGWKLLSSTRTRCDIHWFILKT